MKKLIFLKALIVVSLFGTILTGCSDKEEPKIPPEQEEQPTETPSEKNPFEGYYFDVTGTESAKTASIYQVTDSYFCYHIFKGYSHWAYPRPAKYDAEKKIMAYYDIEAEKYMLLGIDKENDDLVIAQPYRNISKYGSVYDQNILEQILNDCSTDYIDWNNKRTLKGCDKSTFISYNKEYNSLSVNPMAALLVGTWSICLESDGFVADMEFKNYYGYSDSELLDNGKRSEKMNGQFNVTGITLTLPNNSRVATRYGNEFSISFDFVNNTSLGQPTLVTLLSSSGKTLTMERLLL